MEQIAPAFWGLLAITLAGFGLVIRAISKSSASQVTLRAAQDAFFFEQYKKLNDNIDSVKTDLVLANQKIATLESDRVKSEAASRERDKELGALRELDKQREAALGEATKTIEQLKVDVEVKSSTQAAVQAKLDSVALERDNANAALEKSNKAFQENAVTIKKLESELELLKARVDELEKHERLLLVRAETAERNAEKYLADAASYKSLYEAEQAKRVELQAQLDALTNTTPAPTTDPLAVTAAPDTATEVQP